MIRPPSPQPAPEPTSLSVAAGLLILTLAVFGQILTHEFVFDDLGLVVRNPLVHDLNRLPELLGADYWSFTGHPSGLYRPLVLLSFALEHAIFGLEPLGYHAANLALHAAVAWLAFGVVVKLTGDGRLALLAALLFVLHPVHAEAIAPVAGRSELLAAFFFLLAWNSHLQALSGGRRWAVLGWLAFFAALLSKESSVLLPAALLLGDAARAAPRAALRELGLRIGAEIRGGWRRYAAYAAPLLAALALRTYALGAPLKPAGMAIGFVENPLIAAGPWERLWTGFKLIGLYLLKLLVPLRLTSDYYFDQIPLARGPFEPAVLASLLALAGLLALAWNWRSGFAALGLVFLLLTLLPYSQWPFLTGSLFAERFLYLPSLGFCLALAAALQRPMRAWRAAIALLLLCYAIQAAWATRFWNSNQTLFAHAAEVSSRSATAQLNYGLELIENGRDAEGAERLRRALAIYPNIGPAHVALADAHLRLGRIETAEASYRRALRRGADPAVVYGQLGLLAEKRDQLGSAEAWLRRALANDPAAREPRRRLAAVLVERSFRALQSGELQAAQGRAEEALRLAPDNWRGWEASGLVLEQLGRSAEAESSYRRLIELRPQYARGRIHLAGAYIAQGQDSQAERELRGALEIDPELPDAHYGLALVLLRRGQKLPALEQLRIVISLSPKFQPAYQAAIQILESLPASENTTQEAQKLRQRLNALFTTTKQLR